MEYVATLVGGRDAAAFLFGWHSVFCVGRFAAKNTCSTFERATRPRFFISRFARFFASLFSFFRLVCFSIPLLCFALLPSFLVSCLVLSFIVAFMLSIQYNILIYNTLISFVYVRTYARVLLH